MDWDRLVSQLNIVLDKCRVLLQERSVKVWEKVTEKGQREIVTSIDIEIEEFLSNFVHNTYPQATVLGEENYVDPVPLERDICFVIDPLDGTKEFLSGRPGYAISIAILENQLPTAGVLDFPALKQRFWAIRGQGAIVNGKRVRVSQETELHRLRVAVSPSQCKDSRFMAVWKCLREVTLIRIGALTPKVAAVVLGETDAALYFGGNDNIAAIWDFAAAGLILREAGGYFMSLDGKDLLETLPIFHDKGWIATNGVCHGTLLALLSQVTC